MWRSASMPPVTSDPVGEAGGAGRGGGKAGDRVDGHGAPAPAGKRPDPAGDADRLGGVGEVQAGNGGDLQAAGLDPAVAAVAGVVGDRDLAPGQSLELLVQGGLVGLDDRQVGGVLDAGQPVGVLTLGVEGVGGDDSPGQVQRLQQRLEAGDLVGVWSTSVWPRIPPVAWSIAASRWTCGLGWPLPRRVLPSTATACRHATRVGGGGRVVGEGGCCSVSHRPMTWSSASGSTRASTRRTVASPGGRQTRRSGSRRAPSAASTDPGASAAHSPIAARDLAPASTAATATASTVPSACRRPRRWRGSASWARSSSRLRHWWGASAAGTVSRWATAGMGDHEQAGAVIRSGHGL